jgi:hypothetical protein
MIHSRALFVAAGLALAVGCGDHAGGKRVSAQRDESGEEANFGSATDIRSSARQDASNPVNNADNGLGGPVQRQTGNYQSQPVQGQESDNELAKKIKVALTTGSMGTTGVIAEDKLTRIDVAVQNGVVTLRGAVSSDKEKQSIEKQVAGMKGVGAVRNELSVGGRSLQGHPTQPLTPRGPGTE